MKPGRARGLDDQLPRRDILAICAFLNRGRGPKSVDACVAAPDALLEKLSAAARMQ